MAVNDDSRKSGPSVPSHHSSGGAGGDEDIEDEELAPLEIPATDHKLQYTYVLWYIGKTNYQQYDTTLRKIGRFGSVEQFWALYSHIVRPSDLHSPSDFYLFKEGIKPMWEHKGNCNGGQWVVRLNKGLAARCWENLILAILGEQFNVGDEICGAGVSMRPKKDCITLWHKTSADQEALERVRDGMRKVLNLPSHIQMEYKNHRDVMNWVRDRDSREKTGGSGGGGGHDRGDLERSGGYGEGGRTHERERDRDRDRERGAPGMGMGGLGLGLGSSSHPR